MLTAHRRLRQIRKKIFIFQDLGKIQRTKNFKKVISIIIIIIAEDDDLAHCTLKTIMAIPETQLYEQNIKYNLLIIYTVISNGSYSEIVISTKDKKIKSQMAFIFKRLRP